MKRYHGPYRYRHLWRVEERDGSARRSYSFRSRVDAQTAVDRGRAAVVASVLGGDPESVVNLAVPMPDRCSWIYFLYDADRVVYVGCSGNPWDRIEAHREAGKAFDRAALLPDPLDRAAAADLEAALIKAMRPALNLAQVPGASCDVPHSRRRTADPPIG